MGFFQKNALKFVIAAVVVLFFCGLLVQTGAWRTFSTVTGIGDPDAKIGIFDPLLPSVEASMPTPSASVSVTIPTTNPSPSPGPAPDVKQKGGDNIPLYKKAFDELASIPVQDAQTSVKYDRKDDFGDGWLDPDKNGCDTRNDILKRDITAFDKASITYKDTKHCKVNSGNLYDPYTNTVKHFQYGKDTSADVQVDHIVALKDAWLTGAQGWDKDKRIQYANSPDVLLSVDGKTNVAKGDGVCWNVTLNLDVGTCTITKTPIDKTLLVWMPPNKTYWCDYTAKLVEIRKKWGLFMTPQQDKTYKQVLGVCMVGGLF
jgi:hypothetical protein